MKRESIIIDYEIAVWQKNDRNAIKLSLRL